MAKRATAATLKGQIDSLEAEVRFQLEALAGPDGGTPALERSLERLAEAMMWARRHVDGLASRG